MRVLLMFFALILLGCESQTRDVSGAYVLPEGLKDCKVYYMDSDKERDLSVLRCPNSATTTSMTVSSGKTSHAESTTVVDEGESEHQNEVRRCKLHSGQLIHLDSPEGWYCVDKQLSVGKLPLVRLE